MGSLTENTKKRNEKKKKRNDFKQGNQTRKLAVLLTIVFFNIIQSGIVIFLGPPYHPIHSVEM